MKYVLFVVYIILILLAIDSIYNILCGLVSIVRKSRMPIAVNLVDDGTRFELKSAPPDGFVVIKRMTYGQFVKRSNLGTKFRMSGSSGKDNFGGELDISELTESLALYDFANCITEHNLTDVDGRLLNFSDTKDVRKLDGNIGQEIGKYIDEVNSFESDENVKN